MRLPRATTAWSTSPSSKNRRVEKVEDVLNVGDMTWVKFMGFDEKGRANFSRKDALKEIAESGEEVNLISPMSGAKAPGIVVLTQPPLNRELSGGFFAK